MSIRAAPEAVAQHSNVPQRARSRVGCQQVVAQLCLTMRQVEQRRRGRHAPTLLICIQHLRTQPAHVTPAKQRDSRLSEAPFHAKCTEQVVEQLRHALWEVR